MQERPRDWTPPKRAYSYGAKNRAASWAIRFIAIIGAAVVVMGIYQDAPQPRDDSPSVTYSTTAAR